MFLQQNMRSSGKSLMKTEFTEKKISFIKERQYPFNFDTPSDDDWDADTLMYEGFDKDYNATEVGDICEDIIDIATAH